MIFGLGYALPLGLRYGLVAGPGFGVALGLEFWLASGRPKSSHPSIPRTTIPFAVLRGSVLGVAAGWTFDPRFGVWFGVFAAIALIAAYMLRFSPSEEYAPNVRPQLTRRKVVATCVRGLMIGLAGALAGALAHKRGIGLLFGLEIGLVVAVVGGIVATVSPFIEWWADNLPERRLGFFGAMLVLAGFGLQSLQYWAVLLNAPMR